MSGRPKHPTKEFEAVLKSAEGQGWTVTKTTYFKMKCPCDDKDMKMMALSPSNPNYLRNFRKKLARDTCWEDR